MLQENYTQIGEIEKQLRQIYWLVDDKNSDRIINKLQEILDFESANADRTEIPEEEVLAEFCDKYPAGHVNE